MRSSNSKNFSLMIMLAVLLLGIVGYTILSNFNNNPIFTDAHHIAED